jgi:hypothetical protein
MNTRSPSSNSIEYDKKKMIFNSMNILKKKSKFNHIEKIHNDYKYRCIQINITCEIHFDLLDDDQDSGNCFLFYIE